jgi:hypothetical protein
VLIINCSFNKVKERPGIVVKNPPKDIKILWEHIIPLNMMLVVDMMKKWITEVEEETNESCINYGGHPIACHHLINNTKDNKSDKVYYHNNIFYDIITGEPYEL